MKTSILLLLVILCISLYSCEEEELPKQIQQEQVSNTLDCCGDQGQLPTQPGGK